MRAIASGSFLPSGSMRPTDSRKGAEGASILTGVRPDSGESSPLGMVLTLCRRLGWDLKWKMSLVVASLIVKIFFAQAMEASRYIQDLSVVLIREPYFSLAFHSLTSCRTTREGGCQGSTIGLESQSS